VRRSHRLSLQCRRIILFGRDGFNVPSDSVLFLVFFEFSPNKVEYDLANVFVLLLPTRHKRSFESCSCLLVTPCQYMRERSSCGKYYSMKDRGGCNINICVLCCLLLDVEGCEAVMVNNEDQGRDAHGEGMGKLRFFCDLHSEAALGLVNGLTRVLNLCL